MKSMHTHIIALSIGHSTASKTSIYLYHLQV
jgi:hypothetical protein